ncbi:hypothetical protein LFM09_30550 [Lentzea alba]|uniref:hypothetical protein n=1 Tax=Lentzea alba TaxID=2714351 RepID=UPI0039BF2FDF
MNSPQGWPQQPPQQGWQQQPPPPQPGGHPPQGYPQQQGHPGYPQQPPQKKGKGPIVAVVIIGVILLLGGLGTGGFFFFNARKDHGVPLRTGAMPELCTSVSPETLAKARTTNPDVQGSSNPQSDTTNCRWDQTVGRDNPGYRLLWIQIWEGEGKFDDMVGMVTAYSNAKEVGGISSIGDEAKGFVTVRPSEASAEYSLVARKGDHCVLVEYMGADPGLFSLTNPDMDELAEISKTVMNDVLGKL